VTQIRPMVLVVDDEPQIRRLLRNGLTPHGFDMAEATNGGEALRLAATAKPNVIILDLGLPDIDGFSVLERLREWSDVPIIILSVRSRENEKVRALELGADDYVTKPFGMAEFLARIRAALRRHQPETAVPTVFTVDDLVFDSITRKVLLKGADIRLSPKQYRLLQTLVQHAGKVVTHQQLLNEVWGPAHTGDVQYLRVFVKNLRQKIEPYPERPHYLLTELGVGYRMRAPQ
jgi:two-component system, OmpR family, KDP operon response regulator KdpE